MPMEMHDLSQLKAIDSGHVLLLLHVVCVHKERRIKSNYSWNTMQQLVHQHLSVDYEPSFTLYLLVLETIQYKSPSLLPLAVSCIHHGHILNY